MSQSNPESSLRRRRFTDDFKRSAVRLVSEEGYTFKSAAAAVGVSDQTLRAWHARLAPKPEPCGEHATAEDLRQENQRLRKELRRAEMERDILKKSCPFGGVQFGKRVDRRCHR
ncbi:MAG: transposase, partial [Pirellulales bacterium]